MVEKFKKWIDGFESKEGRTLREFRRNIEATRDVPRELNDVMKAADFKKFMGNQESPQKLNLRPRMTYASLEQRDLYNNGEASKPQMEMINNKLDTNRFWAYFRKYYLDKNPADILWLQKCLNKMMGWYNPYTDRNEWGNSIIRVHDEFDGKHNKRKWLKTFLDEQQALYPSGKLALENWNWKVWKIREDGKFGPQTYAVLLFFKSQYLMNSVQSWPANSARKIIRKK